MKKIHKVAEWRSQKQNTECGRPLSAVEVSDDPKKITCKTCRKTFMPSRGGSLDYSVS